MVCTLTIATIRSCRFITLYTICAATLRRIGFAFILSLFEMKSVFAFVIDAFAIDTIPFEKSIAILARFTKISAVL